MSTIRVAFVASNDSSFISIDRGILQEAFSVANVRWNGKRSIPALTAAVARSAVSFSWFALDHAYGAVRLSRLFGKRSIVIVGGVDAANLPDLGYGAHIDERVSARSRYAIAHADRVLVVDDFLREEIAKNAGIQRAGILTVPTGYDTDYFRPDGGPQTTVLTVGPVNEVNLRRKGLLTFADAARRLPELPFVLIGGRENEATRSLSSSAPPNLRILGFVPQEQLLEHYRRARVYVQVSRYEGLPNALAEAMACGCVPVGTRIAGIPTLIGETGYYAPVDDPDSTADAIRMAYRSDKGADARKRIVEGFALERRRQSLVSIVRNLVEESI